jgi:hypothetical protein
MQSPIARSSGMNSLIVESGTVLAGGSAAAGDAASAVWS